MGETIKQEIQGVFLTGKRSMLDMLLLGVTQQREAFR